MEPVKPRITIIEDYKPQRDTLAKLFRSKGYEPIAVADLSTVINYIHSSARNIPDAYLIDLRLPGDNSGANIIRIIRSANHRNPATREPVRIVVYTGLAWPDDRIEAAIEAGADAVVIKSGGFDHLEDVVSGRHPGDVPIPPKEVAS